MKIISTSRQRRSRRKTWFSN